MQRLDLYLSDFFFPPLREWPSLQTSHARQQLALEHCNLRVNDAIQVELSATSEGQVFRRVRKCFRAGHKKGVTL
jgi:hypothetical protein